MKFSLVDEAQTVDATRAVDRRIVSDICQMGTVPQDAQLETIRNLGEHVLPHFRRGA